MSNNVFGMLNVTPKPRKKYENSIKEHNKILLANKLKQTLKPIKKYRPKPTGNLSRVYNNVR